MKRLISIILMILALITFTSCSFNSKVNNISPNKYYEYNGKLHVDGAYLKNEHNEIVELNGVVTPMSSLESRDQWKEYDRLNQLKIWGFNHIRIGYSMSRDVSDEMYQDMCDIIDLLTSLGFYMELIAYNDDTQMGNTTGYNSVVKFLTYFAEKYKNQDNIIYCVGNEPSVGITMKMIDEYSTNVIKEIKKYKKDAVIAVPTPYACSSVDDCVESNIDYDNIIYVGHCYQSQKEKCYNLYRRINTAVSNNKCVYLSEWCAATPSSSEDYISTDEASNTAYLIHKYHLPNAYYNYYPGCDVEGVDGPKLNHLGMIKQKYWRDNYTDPNALTIGGKFAVGLLNNPVTSIYGVNDTDLYTIINNGVNYMFSIWDEGVRTNIENIYFEEMDKKPDVFKEAWNLSYSGLGNVTAYTVVNENKLYDMYIVSDKKIVLPKNSGYMFSKFTSLKHISFKNVDSSNVLNMQFMFSGDTKLKTIDFTGFDASKVTNMFATFANTESLEELDLSSFEAKSLANITGMFQNSGIKKLNMKSFNFNSVTEKGYPFAGSNPEIIVGSEDAKKFILELKSSLNVIVE